MQEALLYIVYLIYYLLLPTCFCLLTYVSLAYLFFYFVITYFYFPIFYIIFLPCDFLTCLVTYFVNVFSDCQPFPSCPAQLCHSLIGFCFPTAN